MILEAIFNNFQSRKSKRERNRPEGQPPHTDDFAHSAPSRPKKERDEPGPTPAPENLHMPKMNMISQNNYRLLSCPGCLLLPILCLNIPAFAWSWNSAINIRLDHKIQVIRSVNSRGLQRTGAFGLKSIQMVAVPPPPPSESNGKNRIRKPPPPPPRIIENARPVGTKEKSSLNRNAHEGTFSNPIDGMVYQDAKGYDLLTNKQTLMPLSCCLVTQRNASCIRQKREKNEV